MVEKGKYHSVLEYNMDRIIKIYQGIIRTIEVTLEEKNFAGNFLPSLNQNYRGQNFRGGYRRNYRNGNYERGRTRSRDR